MKNIAERLAAVKATAVGTSRKSSHPAVIHYLVEELRSKDGNGGFSTAALAAFLTEMKYPIKKTQIHGMVYSESAQKSHARAVKAFQALLDQKDKAALAEVEKYLPKEAAAAA